MTWANYHSHTNYCDGKAAPEVFLSAALAKKFPAYGFSSHAPVPFVSRWNMPAEKLSDYQVHVTRLKDKWKERIELYCGLEIDFIDGLWGYKSSGLKDMGLDYCIGSVHYINRFPDGSYFCFDGAPEAFFKGIELIYHNDFQSALSGYYRTVRNMVDLETPDIIGHMDKIKMHNTVKRYFREDEKWYMDAVEETLELIASRGCILEVNTRGLYKHDPPMLYPSAWILKSAYRKKIPVMLNADSHLPDEIDTGFAETASLLRDIGFRTVRVLYKGNWQDKAFTETGIEF